MRLARNTIFPLTMGKTINTYDLSQLIDTFHGNNESNAKRILDECFVEAPNIDIQAALYLNPKKKILLMLYSKNSQKIKNGSKVVFFVDAPNCTAKTFHTVLY